jgi:thiamine kinase-like enzyme
MPELARLETEVRAALRTAPATAGLADVPLTVEPGGLSNHAWIAATAGGRYFVRLSPVDSARLGVDRRSECVLLQAVADAGLSPAIVRCDPSQRLLVTRHVADHALSRTEAIEPREIGRLAKALHILHAMPRPPGVQRVDFAAQATRLEAQCSGALLIDDDLRSRARTAFATLARGGRRDTLCHNDLHHLNLVGTPDRLWLVDWEYGGTGDPVFDFASFLCQHDCGARERDLLCTAYGNGAPAADQLAAACWAFDYVQWLWYRAWPAGEGADPVYAGRAAAIERRLIERPPA